MKLSLKRGILLGLIIGIGSALLYAPKSGREIREDVKEKLNSVPRNFFNLLESLIDLSLAVLDFAKDAFREQGERFSNALSKGVSAAREKTDELKTLATTRSSH